MVELLQEKSSYNYKLIQFQKSQSLLEWDFF